jgi:hypothetical protein
MPAGDDISDMSLRRLWRLTDGVFGHWMKVNQLDHEFNPFSDLRQLALEDEGF